MSLFCQQPLGRGTRSEGLEKDGVFEEVSEKRGCVGTSAMINLVVMLQRMRLFLCGEMR